MNVEEYFNEIQDYVKNNLDNPSQLDQIITHLQKDNVQAIVNQDYNNQISIEECGDKVLKSIDVQIVDQPEPVAIEGERGMNTMERKVMNYTDFINEGFLTKKEREQAKDLKRKNRREQSEEMGDKNIYNVDYRKRLIDKSEYQKKPEYEKQYNELYYYILDLINDDIDDIDDDMFERFNDNFSLDFYEKVYISDWELEKKQQEVSARLINNIISISYGCDAYTREDIRNYVKRIMK